MKQSLRKLIRTIQSYLFFLKGAKDAYYYYSRALLSKTHEREFKALKFIPDDLPGCYVDIGANQGQTIESIKLMKPSARVYSFEANPLLVKRLRTRYSHRDDITILPFGLADVAEGFTLFVPVYRRFVYDGEASFDKRTAMLPFSSDTLYNFSPEKLELMELPCEVRRLDDQHLDPVFIKIDVQGFESRVIRGAMSTIRRAEPILLIEAFHGDAELMQLTQDLGYEPYLFDDDGFYKSNLVTEAVNTFLMTPARARTVRASSHQAGNALLAND
jgi:FkbM family methyltransferase